MGSKIGFLCLKMLLLLIFYLLDIIIALLTFLLSIIIYAPYIWISTDDKESEQKQEKKPKKKIVIIGYQFAGFEIHKYLQDALPDYEFIIIEPKEYFEFTPAVLNVLCNPSKYSSISFPLTKCFDSTRSELIHGKVISIDSASNCVKIEVIDRDKKEEEKEKEEEYKSITYDYCFICTGSKYAAPIKISIYPSYGDTIYYKEREAMFEEIYSKLNECNGAVGIIGAGPVGVEIMGEIVDVFPNKKITIFDALPTICAPFPDSTKSYLTKWTEKQENVTLKLSAAIKGIEEKENESIKLKLESETLEFDMIFKCWGFRPNSEAIQNNKEFDKCLTDDRFKFIKVDEWMRVKNNIFGLGDVVDQPRLNEIKLIYTAELHAKYLCELMIHLTNKQNKTNDISSFAPYHEWLLGDKIASQQQEQEEKEKEKEKKKKWKMPSVFTISLGSMDGSMGFGNILFDGFISNIFKWFIQVSQCTLYQRKGIIDIKIKNTKIFTMYPIGYRIFSVFWKCAHFITIYYIRHFNKQ